MDKLQYSAFIKLPIFSKKMFQVCALCLVPTPNHLKLLHCGKIHAAKKQRRGYIYSCGKNTLEEILNKKIIDSRELNYFLTELLLSPRYLLKTHFIMLQISPSYFVFLAYMVMVSGRGQSGALQRNRFSILYVKKYISDCFS